MGGCREESVLKDKGAWLKCRRSWIQLTPILTISVTHIYRLFLWLSAHRWTITLNGFCWSTMLVCAWTWSIQRWRWLKYLAFVRSMKWNCWVGWYKPGIEIQDSMRSIRSLVGALGIGLHLLARCIFVTCYSSTWVINNKVIELNWIEFICSQKCNNTIKISYC